MINPPIEPAAGPLPPADFPAALLRVSAEPYRYLDERRVHRLLVAAPRGSLDYLLGTVRQSDTGLFAEPPATREGLTGRGGRSGELP